MAHEIGLGFKTKKDKIIVFSSKTNKDDLVLPEMDVDVIEGQIASIGSLIKKLNRLKII